MCVRVFGDLSSTRVAVVLNTPPRLLSNQFAIAQGETLTLNQTHYNATDAETDDGDLEFTVEYVEHGQFKFANTQNNVTMFSLKQVSAGNISFTADDSGVPPAINMSVSDSGGLVDGPALTEITFVAKTTTPTTTVTSTPTTTTTIATTTSTTTDPITSVPAVNTSSMSTLPTTISPTESPKPTQSPTSSTAVPVVGKEEERSIGTMVGGIVNYICG